MTTARGKAARSRKAAPAQRRDAYSNDVTGLGTTRDKATYGDFSAGKRRSPGWLDALYHDNDIAAAICDCIPEDAFSKGWMLALEGDDAGQLRTDIADDADALGAEDKLTEAWTWGRKSGLGVVHAGVEDGQTPDQPLVMERVTAVRFLTVYDKQEVRPVEWYEDPLNDAKFGRPSVYELRPDAVRTGPTQQGVRQSFGARVHESRMIIFGGARTSRRQRFRNDDTDHSVLQRCVNALLEFSGSWAAVVHMMQDASQFTMGIDGLDRKIAETPEVIEERARIVDFYRSVARAVPYDSKKETLEYVARNFSGLSDVIRWLFQRMCSAAKLSMTRLFGMSPAGLNATGESDLAQHYVQVDSQRRRIAKPAVLYLARMLREARRGTPGRLYVSFPSLWSMSPKEEAEIRESQQRTDVGYIGKEVLLPEEVALSRFTADGWSPETKIDLDVREKVVDEELARAVEQAKNPPPSPPGVPAAPPAPGTPPSPDMLPAEPAKPEPEDEQP